MCRLIAYKNKQMRNKGSYHVITGSYYRSLEDLS